MNVFPTPRILTELGGSLPVPRHLTWDAPSRALPAIDVLQRRLGAHARFERRLEGALCTIRFDDGLPAEGYRLRIDDRVTITAADAAGAGWAAQTLLQLLPAQLFGRGPLPDGALAWPRVDIEDAPRFAWRGAHLDVARHYQPVEFVLHWLDLLAMHKLNVAHLHLTDDQGWRLPVPGYPRLTTVGAWRPGTMLGRHELPGDIVEHDGIPHSGAYTAGELRTIDAHARSLGITVVPEVDLPGHTEALVAAYPELGCRDDIAHPRTCFHVSHHVMNLTPEAFAFCEAVVDTLADLFPHSPLHLGGDECPGDEWFAHPRTRAILEERGIGTTSEAQAWFEEVVCGHALGLGRRVIVWDEVLEYGAPKDVTVMVWRESDTVARSLALGHDTIAATGEYTYLDYAESDAAGEPLAIGVGRTLEQVSRFHTLWEGLEDERLLGGQFQLWTEYQRTPAQLEYFAFPRGTAIAEQLWVGDGSARTTPEALAGQLARLTAMGVAWRRFDPPAARPS